MILQALNDYYERKAADPNSGIAPEGFEYKEIPFVLVLDEGGRLVQIQDTRQKIGKQERARSFLVPKAVKRSGNPEANLLWDNAEFALGACIKNKPEKVLKQHESFKSKIIALGINDVGVNAVLQFLKSNSMEDLKKFDSSGELLEKNSFLSFRLNSDTCLVCERSSVIDEIMKTPSDGIEGECLITGRRGVTTRIQPPIKGVRDTNTTGGDIVSFNKDAFCSYGKKQGFNAPIGEKSAFAYTTALNHLLGKDSAQKYQVGDATTVFWSDRRNHLEDDFSDWFDEPEKDNPDKLTDKVKALLRAVDTGTYPSEDDNVKFFVLGLSPNAARISIRFWHTGTVAEFSRKIAHHFRDLEIAHGPKQRDHLSIWWLLCSIAALGKSENIPPNLAGDWMRTILNGSPYPETLFQSAVRRIHADREVSYERAAIIKACLNRKNRFQTLTEKEMTVSLDNNNTNPGYRIGRLFAVLEKIQEEASPRINATIRDRYYSSASGTPATVFPILLRMKNHHLGKLVKGREVYFEKLLGEVVNEVGANGFPAQLSLADQGRFAIGYYHQRQAFFTK